MDLVYVFLIVIKSAYIPIREFISPDVFKWTLDNIDYTHLVIGRGSCSHAGLF